MICSNVAAYILNALMRKERGQGGTKIRDLKIKLFCRCEFVADAYVSTMDQILKYYFDERELLYNFSWKEGKRNHF